MKSGISLFVNGKVNPIGVDGKSIRLSFKSLNGFNKAQFKVYDNKENLKLNAPCFQKETNEYFVYFDAVGKETGTKMFFNVETEIDGQKFISDTASFELGLNKTKDQETWIENPNFNGQVSEFKKEFYLNETPTSARLYIVGLGMYESRVNGEKTDEFYFKPLLTDFDYRIGINNVDYDEPNFYNDKKSICYDTFDVTNLLKKGENSINVLLGTGWYCNDDKLSTDPCDKFGNPCLFFELHAIYGDNKIVIKSDADCLVRNTGRISQLFKGDHYDFNDKGSDYINAKLRNAPAGKLTERLCEHDSVYETLKPISTVKANKITEYDFGKNHSGSIKMSVRGKKGDKLTIRYYEVKDRTGLNPRTSEWIGYDVTGEKPIPVLSVTQCDTYVLSGGVDQISPLFHWNSYRYVTVEIDDGCEILNVESLFICTGIKQNSTFKCSDEFINKFYDAFILTQLDNMHCGVPSDCPHREKLPYTGDGNLVAEPTLYTMDAENFYRKWYKDVLDAQGNNGWMPYTAPYIGGAGGYWWSKIITALPLNIYRITGDKKILYDGIEHVFKYLDFCNNIHDGDYILKKSHVRWIIGDWLNPDPTVSSVELMNTLAYYCSVLDVIEICKIINDDRANQLYLLKEKIKDAINKNFFDEKKLTYGKGIQGENILPLLLGIVDKMFENKLWEKTVVFYKENGYFDTGIVLTPLLLELLTSRGEEELAYKLFTYDGKPSFKYMLDNETTLLEHWNKFWPSVSYGDGKDDIEGGGDVSHCHPMFGSVVSWFYKSIAGLDLSKMCDRKIVVNPRLYKIIKSAKATKETPYGLISVCYDTANGFIMNLVVPKGLTAEIMLDGRYECNGKITDGKFELTGGKYLIKAI